MKMAQIEGKLREWALTLKGRFLGVLGLFRAVWKGGIPSRFALFLFVVGMVLGVGAKYLAWERFTIGYGDYTLTPASRVYDLNAAADRFQTAGGSLSPQNEKSTYPAESLEEATLPQ